MKYCKTLSTALLALTIFNTTSFAATDKWSFLTYIQADNDLAPFANLNLHDMQKVGSTTDVNVLVQWDKPKDNITYRYKILQNNLVENNSIKQEMGFYPAKELVDSMKWVQKNFAADRHALILWDHGNGVLDRANHQRKLNSWLGLPGLTRKFWQERGILYDYSQNTFLDNIGLSSACADIKKTIGKNIALLGMDACLMAMIEIAYQVKDSVDYITASQQTEPGTGWPYADVLSSLVGMPTLSTADFAAAIVHAYSNFYSTGANADSSYTLSAIDVSKISAATTAFNNVLTAIAQSQAIDRTTTNAAIKKARTNTLSFYIPDYVDMVDLYDNLTTEFTKLSSTRRKKSSIPSRDRASQAAAAVISAIEIAKQAALAAVTASSTGPEYSGKAHGLSLYFPANGKVDASYKKTTFAKQTSWTTLLASLRA
jgi:hypothetical protein